MGRKKRKKKKNPPAGQAVVGVQRWVKGGKQNYYWDRFSFLVSIDGVIGCNAVERGAAVERGQPGGGSEFTQS